MDAQEFQKEPSKILAIWNTENPNIIANKLNNTI